MHSCSYCSMQLLISGHRGMHSWPSSCCYWSYSTLQLRNANQGVRTVKQAVPKTHLSVALVNVQPMNT